MVAKAKLRPPEVKIVERSGWSNEHRVVLWEIGAHVGIQVRGGYGSCCGSATLYFGGGDGPKLLKGLLVVSDQEGVKLSVEGRWGTGKQPDSEKLTENHPLAEAYWDYVRAYLDAFHKGLSKIYMYNAILTQTQMNNWWSLLEEYGWERSRGYVNGNSGRTLYCLTLGVPSKKKA